MISILHSNFFTPTVTINFERLMGPPVAAIGVGFILSGIANYFPGLL